MGLIKLIVTLFSKVMEDAIDYAMMAISNNVLTDAWFRSCQDHLAPYLTTAMNHIQR